MGRYVFLDAAGVAVNIILWDGVSSYSLEEGYSLMPEEEYVPPAIEE